MPLPDEPQLRRAGPVSRVVISHHAKTSLQAIGRPGEPDSCLGTRRTWMPGTPGSLLHQA
jgi:hypothetical protein